jgi:predicted transcriptional regulator
MKQLTLRVSEELVGRLKDVAAERHESVNSYAEAVLNAAVDPELAGDEVERLRERLARAGVLMTSTRPVRRPSDRALAKARRAAGKGKPLSDYLIEDKA